MGPGSDDFGVPTALGRRAATLYTALGLILQGGPELLQLRGKPTVVRISKRMGLSVSKIGDHVFNVRG